MLSISIKKFQIPYLPATIGLTYLLIILWLVPGYLKWDTNVYAGILLTPFICTVNKGKFSIRYLIPALITLAIAVLMPVRTTLFLAMVFTTLLFIENSLGKLGDAFLFLIVLISPVFKYALTLVDFPVRLWLTGQVAALLNSAGIKAAAAGNQIEMTNSVFSLDPACAGLHMLVMSLVICLFLLTYHQRKLNKQIRFFSLTAIFTLTIGLNIVCNFFRILLLVTFKIMPGTLLHDLVGIACLIIYVFIPLMIGLKLIINRFGHTKEALQIVKPADQFRYPLLHSLLLIISLFVAFRVVPADAFVYKPGEINMEGFKKQQMENGIYKFENQEALIYIKPTVFYAPEHDPKICWTGSGYIFKSIQKERWNGFELYTAVLEKGKDKIYAAWWFDNGTTRTTDQITWRWKGLKGEPRFYLVNVNASSQKTLKAEVGKIHKNQSYLR